MCPEPYRGSQSHHSRGRSPGQASESSVHEQFHPYDKVHVINILAKKFVRTISSICQSILSLHRPAQLGSGH